MKWCLLLRRRVEAPLEISLAGGESVRVQGAGERVSLSEAWKAKGLLILKSQEVTWAALDDAPDTCLDRMAITGLSGDLPRCRWHQLNRWQHSLANQLVDEARDAP